MADAAPAQVRMRWLNTDIGPMVPAADAFTLFAWPDAKMNLRRTGSSLDTGQRRIGRSLRVRLEIESRSDEEEAQFIPYGLITLQPLLRNEQIHFGIER